MNFEYTLSQKMQLTTGLRQGDAMSPILYVFNIFERDGLEDQKYRRSKLKSYLLYFTRSKIIFNTNLLKITQFINQ